MAIQTARQTSQLHPVLRHRATIPIEHPIRSVKIGRDSLKGLKMKYLRCGSSMFCEKIYTQEEQLVFWRCIFCGDYIDQVVFQNREYQKMGREINSKKKEA
jgi:hypothetical protein